MEELHLGAYLRNHTLGFSRTSRFVVLGLASDDDLPVTETVVRETKTTAVASEASNPPGDIISARIKAIADEIRDLKAAKAPKDDIMAKVKEMNELKAEFESVTGSPFLPAVAPREAKSKKDKSGAQCSGGGGGGGSAPTAQAAEGEGSAAGAAEVAAAAEAKFAVLRSIGEECVTDADLRTLLSKKPDSFRLYDGFEPSGRMHIAQGIFKAINVNKCAGAGGTFVFWVADWFALMNDKMGGDLAKIKDVGRYFVEVWTAAGMDMSKVEFRWASEDITKNASSYWPQMLDIARRFTLARVNKCCTIMGRAEGNLTAAQILYPIMQCTDIFFLRADICQLGVDQRKVNMLAREYCDGAGIKLKPVILSHHMLYGLKQGQAKMSKSDPDSAIFMEDSREDIERKLMQAYCPKSKSGQAPKEGGLENEMRLVADDLENPCLDYVEHIVFAGGGAAGAVVGAGAGAVGARTFTAGPDKAEDLGTGGGRTYHSFSEVKRAFLSGDLSEHGLKSGLVSAVDALVAPVREHFKHNAEAKALLARIQEYKKESPSAEGESSKPLRRLTTLDTAGTKLKARHVVCAPLPLGPMLPLGTVFTLLKRLKATTTHGEAGEELKELVLWLPDWSSLVLSCLNGDAKAIRAAFTLLVEAMTAVDDFAAKSNPGGWGDKVMPRVKVMFQSEVILSAPSDYWISVINVGRSLKVHQVRLGYLGGAWTPPPPAAPTTAPAGTASSSAEAAAAVELDPDSQTKAVVQAVSEPAGCVVSALMHCGDVLGLAPGTLACGTGQDRAPHDLALKYWEEAGLRERNGLSPPAVLAVPDVSTRMDSNLQPHGDLPSHKVTCGFASAASDDDYFVGDDPKAGANKKMKRAFCEPGNTGNNPPLAIAKDVLLSVFGQVDLSSGGGAVYSGQGAASTMDADFASDSLTPQLLKPCVTSGMAEVLDALNGQLKTSPNAKKADATLKQWLKSAAKSAGGKKK